jgi:hypothetical protein
MVPIVSANKKICEVPANRSTPVVHMFCPAVPLLLLYLVSRSVDQPTRSRKRLGVARRQLDLRTPDFAQFEGHIDLLGPPEKGFITATCCNFGQPWHVSRAAWQVMLVRRPPSVSSKGLQIRSFERVFSQLLRFSSRSGQPQRMMTNYFGTMFAIFLERPLRTAASASSPDRSEYGGTRMRGGHACHWA